MDVSLIDLRRYAVDNRVEIRFGNPELKRMCVINPKGHITIPTVDKEFRIEDVLSAATVFEIHSGENVETIARTQMGSTLGNAFKARGFAASQHDEDE